MEPISRRKFIQLSVLTGAAAAAGCKNAALYRSEVSGRYGGESDRIEPYVVQPAGLEDGIPQYFATTCGMCPAGCGLLVRTMGGRAVKVEGNPIHPVNRGATCARGQASLQHLYNPDRLRYPAIRPARAQPAQKSDWPAALAEVRSRLDSVRGRIAVLADRTTIGASPGLRATVADFARSAGASITFYSLLDESPATHASRVYYGRNQIPAYRFDQADFVLSFGADFLEAWPSPVHDGRLFGEFRRGTRKTGLDHGRFVYIGPRMSMTAAKADLWLPALPGSEWAVALGILTALGGDGLPVEAAAQESGLDPRDIERTASRFAEAGRRALALGPALALYPNSGTCALAAQALNIRAGSECVEFGQSAVYSGPSSFEQIQSLLAEIRSGAIEALVMTGMANPVYTLPSALGFADALGRIPFIAAITPFEDETTSFADVLLPARTFLEEWGDSAPLVAPAGYAVESVRQPVIDPSYIKPRYDPHGESWLDAREMGAILWELAASPLRPSGPRAGAERGGVWTTVEAGAKTPAGLPGKISSLRRPLEAGSYALYLSPHVYWGDGRHANLPWLQEIPDPMTSGVWNSWVEINLDEARRLGIRTGDIVRVSSEHGAVEAAAVPSPGIHPRAVAMPIGQGHKAYGRFASRGVNPLTIIDPAPDSESGALSLCGTPVTLSKVRSAHPGYDPAGGTLVLAQDRPGGTEPDAVKNLIHETYRSKRAAAERSGADG